MDILVHALSDLEAKRGRKCAWKAATRAVLWGRRWTVTRRRVAWSLPPLCFFLKHQNGAVLDQKLGIFADFQLSPLAFNFFNVTPGFCQLDPYSLVPFAYWPLALDFVNLTPNWPQNFSFLSIWPLISIN
jgi:hypothetical protein